MPRSRLSRRRFLFAAGATVLTAPLLAACQGATASPTTAPKTGGESKPAATSATKAEGTTAAKPTAGAQATTAAPKTSSGAATQLSIAVWTDAVRTWMTDRSKKYDDEHDDVTLELVQIPYADMEKKQLTMIATNTMPDVVFSGVKWFAYSAFKGAFYALDDLVKTNDPGIDDFFKDSIAGSTLDGKLYALPFEVNTGNTNIVIYNKDMVAEKGVKEPTDTWTMEEFADAAAKLTDKGKNVFGTNLLTNNYYDLATWARSLGGDILSDDGKQFTLTTDEKTLETTKWEVELRTQHNAAPNRAESQDLAFPAGQLAFFNTGIYSVLGIGKTVGDKFKWDAVLGPTGPNGLRGYEMFVTMYSMSAKTKAPDKAYDLLTYMTSKETALFAFLEQGQPPARASIWESPEAQKLNPIWGRAAKWLAEGKAEGPFPMPYNLRFSELQDKFGNLIQPVLYGEIGFEEGTKKVQEECQQIVALPRG